MYHVSHLATLSRSKVQNMYSKERNWTRVKYEAKHTNCQDIPVMKQYNQLFVCISSAIIQKSEVSWLNISASSTSYIQLNLMLYILTDLSQLTHDDNTRIATSPASQAVPWILPATQRGNALNRDIHFSSSVIRFRKSLNVLEFKMKSINIVTDYEVRMKPRGLILHAC
jgi:hypothetical protein